MSKGLSYIPRKEQTENLMQKSFLLEWVKLQNFKSIFKDKSNTNLFKA